MHRAAQHPPAGFDTGMALLSTYCEQQANGHQIGLDKKQKASGKVKLSNDDRIPNCDQAKNRRSHTLVCHAL
ncbi:hypothetical protein KDK_68990 [Dictyobacter kobayashii]|uniref:Uncharacterized protein n=1 Tax=Dictyobacter kobayashii TaxID=2014872 RepID=A0A402AVJ7_9CHLR|nr:hypothetical protein KDK_68990 [Dictyobacter kobayashii]